MLSRPRLTLAAGLFCAALGGFADHTRAQCTGQWLPGTGTTGISGTVYASTTWDPDGAGPLAPVLVVGGSFTLADSTAATNIAYWDGAAWNALGSGLGSPTASAPVVKALAVYNGSLVAGGSFNVSGASALGNIGRWDGAAWVPLNSGTTKDFPAEVNALAIASNGDLIAGGSFTTVGTNTTGTIVANRLARFNGTQWSPLDPNALTTVTGSFSSSNTPARTLSRTTGSFITDGFVVNAKVAISGFTTAGNNKATVTISAVTATTLTFSATGFGTAFTSETANVTLTRIDIGANGAVNALALASNGDVIVGGAFTTVGTTSTVSTTVNRVARWTGTAWAQLGSGMGGTVNALAVKTNGDIIAGGAYSNAPATVSGQPATPATNHVIRWDVASSTWVAMDNGVGTAGTPDSNVRVLALLASGDVVAAGDFWTANGVYVGGIARWNGTTWSAVWSRTEPRVVATLLSRADGSVVVGGSFKTANGVGASGVATWDGASTWQAVTSAAPSSSGPVTELFLMGNGDVLAGGAFSVLEGASVSRVARLSGTSASAKSSLGSGLVSTDAPFPSTVVNQNPPVAFASMLNGDIMCGSIDITATVGGSPAVLTRWNGATWSEQTPDLGAAPVYGPPFPDLGLIKSLAVMPNGDLLAGGLFFFPGDAFTFHFLARFDGTQWTDLGIATGAVEKIIVRPDGSVVIGGDFILANGALGADYIAEWDGSSTYGDGTPVWMPLGQGANGPVDAVVRLPNGDLVIGGQFTQVGNAAAGDLTVNRVARWNGSAWSRLGSGMSDDVYALAVMPNGDVVAGGAFTGAVSIAGETATPAVGRIARWNGTAWGGLGTGLGSAGFVSNLNRPLGSVFALAVTPSGVLLVGGDFATAGGGASSYLARWADCVGACCQADGSCQATSGSPSASCSSGTLVLGGTCSPNACPQPAGVCCRGATCNATVSSGSCVGGDSAGAFYATGSSVCNAAANTTAPCCYPDYNKTGGITVGDIFDYLNSWFAGSLFAKVGGDGTTGVLAVSDIFDFLNAWFAGGC